MGEDRAYVRSRPTLDAVLYDGEAQSRVSGEFEVRWTDASGTEQRLTLETTAKASGSVFRVQVPQDIPPHTVISWQARAHDTTSASPWSSEGGGSFCEFLYDNTAPAAPVVTSADYPDDHTWHDGVGVYGDFTIDSPADDVVSYVYNFIGGPQRTARPDQPGGPVTISHLPDRSGVAGLSVNALDRAGNTSARTDYTFRVQSGRAPVAHWPLADPAGSTTAAPENGPASRAGTGVTFGADGPRGVSPASTASLDGGDQAFLTPDTSVVAAGKTFAVSAWVRPGRTDRSMTAAGQDAGGAAGLDLGLHVEESGPAWSFAVGGARVSGGAPETGEWAHLLGLYDAKTGQARLYVNGVEAGSAAEAAPVATAGDFQIGRARDGDGYRGAWQGEIGGVRVHDRVVVPDEVKEFAKRRPTPLGRWQLETATDGASPETRGGAPLALGPGASVQRGPDGSCLPDIDPDCPPDPGILVGDGHLHLDGETGYGATAGPVVDTTDSFTVGAVVRLADTEPDHPMTVLSQAGEHTDVFKVRYAPAENAWQLVMPLRDEAGAPETVVADFAWPDGGAGPGQRLAVVYDDAADRIRLYVDGSLSADATASFPAGLESTGPLQVGRAKAGDGWGEYLRGDVDEVHAYAGVLSDTAIIQMGMGVDPCDC
ncbi:LamG-like jellyroll fold domain-containing protein [Streptomyces sp. NPDC088387]|uniref:LamG domain-containing protein n=1 Tax=Streptomyces sp. NPDC088387 TaxID=3365859 RepID=UPI0037F3446D